MNVAGFNSRGDVPAAPKLTTRHYGDVDAQAASVPGHDQTYSQLTAGRFEGVVHSHIISPKAALFLEATNRGIRKQFCVPPGSLRIGYLLDEVTKCNVNGTRMSGHDLFANLPMTEIDLHFSDDHHAAWITLDFEEVRGMIRLNEEPCDLHQTGRLQLASKAGGLFRMTLAAARQELFNPGKTRPPASTVAAFEKILFSLAAWTVTTALGSDLEMRRSSAAHRARLLRKACEIIDARLMEGLTMFELCQMIGTSRRTLENIFVEALGVSPYQYVRTLRLNSIRKALLLEENANSTIGDIVGGWGIWHLSRFAADYRSMFGELPSQTRAGLALRASGGCASVDPAGVLSRRLE